MSQYFLKKELRSFGFNFLHRENMFLSIRLHVKFLALFEKAQKIPARNEPEHFAGEETDEAAITLLHRYRSH